MSVIAISDRLNEARAHLVSTPRRDRSLPAVGAALLAAVTSLMLAAAVVLGPGVEAPSPSASISH